MKKILLTYLLTAITALAVELNFSAMENGDRVEITSKSSGCFHDTTHYYEVKKIDGACHMTEFAITWDKSVPPLLVEKKIVGEIKLTQEDLSGLDGLLRFYRGKKDAFSTTQNSLLVEYFEGGKRIKVEKLKDESGGYDLEKRKDVISFYQLSQRFPK